MKTNYTITLSKQQTQALAAWFESKEAAGQWTAYSVPYARFAYKGDQVNVVAYSSQKLVVAGKQTASFVQNVLEPEVTGEARLGYDAVHHPERFELHAGCDESGKGDLFGPLVTACVIADGPMVRKWMDAGICDSKRLSDRSILKLDQLIRETEGVVVTSAFARMAKYNQLYDKFGRNVNRLLAWYHGRSLNQALDQRSAPWGLLDQFSRQKLVDVYVKERTDFRLESRTKAESDPVVAAASIVARAIYVREMGRLSQAFGQELKKGASAAVRSQAQAIFSERGVEGLEHSAKMHFRTAYEAQGLEPPLKKYVYKRST